MKVVVTGATGFVGRAVVGALTSRGDRVVVLSRSASHARERLPGVEVVEAALESRGPWERALENVDALVHLAGEPVAGKRWDARQKQVIRDSRVETTRTVVEAISALAPELRPRALICASGIDYYPFGPDDRTFDDDEVTEADPPGDSFLARVCRDWETEAQAAEGLGVRVARMRTGLVLGPGGGALERMTTPFKWFVGGRIGHGRQFVSWIHLDDAVGAYFSAVHDERYRGPINLVAGSVRNRELSAALGDALRRPSWMPVPAFAVRASVGEIAESLLQGRNAVPARLRQLGFSWRFPELRAAIAACV